MSDYTTTATVNLQMNGQQPVQVLTNLKQRAKELQTEISKAAMAGDKTKLTNLRKELRNTNRQIKEVEKATTNVDAALHRLDLATPKELKKTLGILEKQLNGMKRGTAAWDAQMNKIKLVRAEIDKLNVQMKANQSLWTRFNVALNNMQTSLMGMITALTGLIYAGRNAVNSFAKMEEEMANTRKYTGMTEAAVRDLNEAFLRMDTRTGREELNELAQEAGRLGKKTQSSVQGYVEAANIIKVALVDLGEGATQTIAKISNIFGVEQLLGTRDAMLAVGSTVNVLSQNCTASKPYIVEFAQRMAGIGAQAKMTIPEIMAFAATLDANGQKVEMSASALSRVIMKLYQEPEKITQRLGINTEKFMETMHRSTNEGLMWFLQTLHDIGNEDALAALAPIFDDLGMDGIRLSQVLATLAEHLDMVKWEQKEANKAFNEATSATREYQIFNNTVQATIDKAIKRIHELAVQLGEKLLPVVRHIMTSGSAMLRFLNLTVDFIVENRRAIITLSATIAAYTIAVKASAAAHAIWNAITTSGTVIMATWDKAVIASRIVWYTLTGQIERAKSAVVAFNLMTKTTPWGWIVAGVTAVVTGLIMLGNHLNEATQLEKDFEEMENKVNEATAEQITKVDILNKKVHDNNLTNYERIKAIDQLKAIIPEYNAMLDEEGRLINDNTSAIVNYIQAIKDMARAQAAQEKMVEIQKELMQLDQEIAEEEKKAEDPSNKRRGGYLMTNSDKAELRVIQLKSAKKDKENELDAVANWGKVTKDGNNKTNTQMEEINQDLYKRNKEYKEKVDAIEEEWQKTFLNPENSKVDVSHTFKVPSSSSKPIPNHPPYYQEQENMLDPNYFQSKGLQVQKPDTTPKSKTDFARDKRNVAIFQLNQQYSGTVDDDYTYTPRPEEEKKGNKAKEDKFKAEKDWKTREEALARISYATGETNYEEYTKKMDEISIEFYTKELNHQDLTQTERLDIRAEFYEAVKKKTQDFNEFSIKAEDAQYNEELAKLKQKYIDGEITTSVYEESAEQMELKHLQTQERIYKHYAEQENGYSEDAKKKLLEIQKVYSDKMLAAQKKKQSEAEKLAKEHEKKLQSIKKEYMGNTIAENKKLYEEDLANLTEVYNRMVDSLEHEEVKTFSNDGLDTTLTTEIRLTESAAKEKLKIEEAYQKAKIALMKKYNIEGADDNLNFLNKMSNDIVEWLESDGGKAITGTLDTLVSGMSSIFSQLTTIVEAELEIQTAAIQKRYDKEIKSAEGNGYMVARLEKKKEAEIAQAKNEANKKMYAMQVLQAVAQTATGAINAYSSAAAVPYVGYILAPIAAAMAVAAGAIQIAAIKKQQQASLAQGYSEGGFTKPGDVDEVAGVVHAGEWVASQKLLASPEARPLINALDYAQRTNTIGSLKAADVSRSITAPSVIASNTNGESVATSMTANAMALASYTGVINKLNERLNEPFVTVNTVTGDSGIKKAQDDYEKLMKNKTNKRSR